MSIPSVTSASTTPLFVGPLLSWTSSTARMAGAPRFETMREARPSNFACGSPGLRLLTLNVAIVRRAGVLARPVVSGDRSASVSAGSGCWSFTM